MNFTTIGKTLKPYGLDGGLKVAIQEAYLEDFLQAAFLFIEQKGQPVPFFLEEIDSDQWIVYLEDIENKDHAEALSKKPISIPSVDLIPKEERLFIPPSKLKYEKYKGFTLVEQKMGKLEVIQDIIAYPQQEMALVSYKNSDILIPLNPSFIQSIDEENQIITVTLPEGIIDIQL